MRILHVVDNMGRGGMQNGLVNLSSRLLPPRFEHVICSTRYLEPTRAHQFSSDGVRVLSIGRESGHDHFQVPALVHVIRQVKPDIIHSRNWGGVEAILAGRWTRGAALVHSEHGLDADPSAVEPWRRRAFRRLIYELADRVLCVSHHLKQVHAGRTGFPEHKIAVIHNGVDTARFSPRPQVRAYVRHELGIAPGDFCIGCVGSLTPVKDYPTVLQAADEIARRLPDWRLLVIGEGPERSRLEEFLNAHPQWSGRVRFLGLSTRIPELLNALDVYVLSSVTEGISNSLLEAMATGLPPVVTDAGGNPEVIVDGTSGILFPVGDSRALAQHLLHLQARPGERSRIAEQALHNVQSGFSLEAMVRNYENLYESLLRHPSPREVICT